MLHSYILMCFHLLALGVGDVADVSMIWNGPKKISVMNTKGLGRVNHFRSCCLPTFFVFLTLFVCSISFFFPLVLIFFFVSCSVSQHSERVASRKE